MPQETLEPILIEAIPLDEPLQKGFEYKSGENLDDIVCRKGFPLLTEKERIFIQIAYRKNWDMNMAYQTLSE